MVEVSAFEVFLGLLLLGITVLPLGAVLLRSGERISRRRVELTAPERLLVAFYASGTLLFILGSIPVAFYGLVLLWLVLGAGAVAYTLISYRERGIGIRSILSFAASVPGLLLGSLLLILLATEVSGIASLTLANMLDGSLHSLFINLLLSNHTLPWTYSPYASVGVTYPQGAPVWMSVPVLLFGWPIVSAPLDVPPLFLALSPVAAYCLGERLAAGYSGLPRSWVGVLFAALFGLLFSWPRLWVGGSFDFAFGLPLFLLLLGWTVPFVRVTDRSWTEVAGFGVVIGIEISLSAMLGITTLLLLAGYILALRLPNGPKPIGWAVRWLAMVGIAAMFIVRSLIGIAVWFGYPGRVLSPVGSPPTAPAQLTTTLTYSSVNDAINPFIFLRPMVSPFPVLAVEITLLLAAGVILIGIAVGRPTLPLARYLPRQAVSTILVGTVVLLAETVGIILADTATPNASGVESITNLGEASTVLFLFYELIATLPLLAAASYAVSHWERRSSPAPQPMFDPPLRRSTGHRFDRIPPVRVLLVALVIMVPVASGLGATTALVPSYIGDHIHEFANVSSEDISALERTGSELPSCSRVLVAPGSVGQYLPEFARVTVVFPMFPPSANLSYYVVVGDLISGVYTDVTRASLLQLGVTEIFVSGPNDVGYPPFQVVSLRASPDFVTLFSLGDVTVLEFLPGAASSGCTP